LENRIKELEKAAKITSDQTASDTSLESLINRLETLEKHSIQSQKEPEQRKIHVTPKRQKLKYVPFNMEEVFITKRYTRFYIVKIDQRKIRSVNPYEITKEIKRVTGSSPKSVTSERRDSFTIEVRDEAQGEEILKMKQVDGVDCIVEKHPFHNQSKGIIYIQEYEITDENLHEFEAGLKNNTEFNIKNVQLAKFIKPKNEQTTPVLVTFEQEDTPEYLYIPGERSDSKVYPYQSRPMKCNKCMQYGHTAKRCTRESEVCNRCSENGHTGRDCKSPVLKCLHCKGDHRTGDKTCETQILEQQILDTQNIYKVSKMRAKQIINQKTEEPKQCEKKNIQPPSNVFSIRAKKENYHHGPLKNA